MQHLIGEAFSFLADQIALRHPHALEEDLRGVRRAHAELVELAGDLDAFGLHRHADQRFVLVRRAVGGVGKQAHPVGLRAVGGPHLAAIDDVIAAVLARGGLDRGDVGAGADLGDAEARHVIPSDRRRQKFARTASEPKRASAGVAMSVWTPIAIGTPPQSMPPSSSAITMA